MIVTLLALIIVSVISRFDSGIGETLSTNIGITFVEISIVAIIGIVIGTVLFIGKTLKKGKNEE